jgi:hypothetical protein
VGAWLVSMAILPASSRGLLDRLVAIPFLDWLSPQFSPLDIFELVLLVALAWYAARSRAEASSVGTLRTQ